MKLTETKRRLETSALVFLALCCVLNIVGGALALALRLPIYLDTIGTVLAGILLGPISGMLVGGVTGLVNAALFDPTSLYYTPTGIILGGLTGFFFKNHRFEGIKSILSIIVITLAGSVVSSIVTAFVFSGVTSSGSSYVVALLRSMGADVFGAVFSTQIFSDLADKALSFWIAFLIISALPKTYLNKLVGLRRQAK